MQNIRGKPLFTYFKWAIRVLAVLFALFHLYTAIVGPFPNIIQRSLHVGGALSLFLLLSITKKDETFSKNVINCLLLLLTIISVLYLIFNFERIIHPRFQPEFFDISVAFAMVLVVLESTRRMMGWFIPALALFLMVYAYFGSYFPGMWHHNGVSIEYLSQVLFFSTRGLWGTVTEISVSVIAIFVIFGGVLFATGGAKSFMDLASKLTANSYGGAAKVSAVASGLFGSISGSAGANVATTGAFTIPLMKKLKYKPEFAGGVESAASTGGQIMPPIMGAGAFIMAEIIGVPYVEIILAALIPAILFYFGVIMAIDFEARKLNYRGVPKDQIPKLSSILHWSNSLPVFLPILVLLYFFFIGYTPTGSAIRAIGVAALFYILIDMKNIWPRIKNLIKGLEQSSKDMLPIIALIACAQIILSMITVTGIGVKLANLIVNIGNEYLILAGLLAMVATMIIGMGLPTVGAYLLAAAVLAPALSRLGMEPIAAHFFIFYFAIFAGITPPVCGTVFIGAAIAKANWLKTAWVALRLSAAAFIIPFMFLQSPALLLVGTWLEIALATITSAIGVLAIAAGAMGYFILITKAWERIVLVMAGFLLIFHGIETDVLGIVLMAVVLIVQLSKKKKMSFLEAA
jgi:TRAP transporter 4TM/12TM fusion protein